MEEYQEVWIFAEQKSGKLATVSFELLGKGRELANILKVKLTAVLLGHEVKKLCPDLISYGADRVLVADDPEIQLYRTDTYTRIITRQVRQHKPAIFLFGATPLGRDLAPRIARRLGTGLSADCTGLDIDAKTGLLLQTLPAYGGNVVATIVTPNHRPQMATVRPRVMEALSKDTSRSGEILHIPVEIESQDLRVRILDTLKEASKGVDLQEAEVIVAGGKGLAGPNDIKLLEELAHVLGGAVGVSRSVVDAGWVSSSHLIGQTGETVRPKLYIACGISGAAQHMAGIQDAETIVAINTDPKAPIFRLADYCIIGDLHQVVPALTAELTHYKAAFTNSLIIKWSR